VSDFEDHVTRRLRQIAEERWKDMPAELSRESHVCWTAADELEERREACAAQSRLKATHALEMEGLRERCAEIADDHGHHHLAYLMRSLPITTPTAEAVTRLVEAAQGILNDMRVIEAVAGIEVIRYREPALNWIIDLDAALSAPEVQAFLPKETK